MLQISSPTSLIYGATGTYKTHNVGLFARYIYEKTGKRTRLIATDTHVEPIQDYIDAGVIEPIFLSDRVDLLGIVVQLCRGYWPKGEKLERGYLIEEVGGYAFEGLTSLAQLLMQHLAAKGQKINEDVVGKFSEAGVEFGAAPRSYYGFVPNQLYSMLTDLGTLPVDRVLITSHEGKGKDEFSQQLVYGPAAVGTAATNRIPPYVGDLFHFDTVETVVGQKREIEVRAYFKPHPDPQTKILWPAKVRMRSQHIPHLAKAFPEGYIKLELDQGIDRFFRLQDELSKVSVAEVQKFREDIDAKRKATT